MSNLVEVATEDKLYLQGLLISGDKTKPAVLYIHGFEGNFYQDNFSRVLLKEFEKNNHTFLTGNNRGHEKDTDINTTDGKIVRIGAHYELLEDSPKDIDAWMKFLIDQGYKYVVLVGHSLGTYKVVRYLFQGKHKDNIKKLILMCPFDKEGLMRDYTKTPVKELIKRAEEKVKEGKREELITREFEIIDMCYNTWLSWYKQDDLGRMFEFCNKDYNFPIFKSIKVPTKVIVGSKDEYFHTSNPDHPEEAMEIMLKNIPNSEGKIIEGARHQFTGYEEVLAKEVLDFIQ